jgi:hypothetical protein
MAGNATSPARSAATHTHPLGTETVYEWTWAASGGSRSTTTTTALVVPLTTVFTLPLSGADRRHMRAARVLERVARRVHSPGICPFNVGFSAWPREFASFTQLGSGEAMRPRSDKTAMIQRESNQKSGYECDPTYTVRAVEPGSRRPRKSVPAFENRWKDSDLALVGTHPLTPPLAASTPASGVLGSSSASAPRKTDDGKTSILDDVAGTGLGRGAIAGIAVAHLTGCACCGWCFLPVV